MTDMESTSQNLNNEEEENQKEENPDMEMDQQEPLDNAAEDTGDNTGMNIDHKRLIEAALLMSSEPISLEKLSKIVGVHSLGYLKGIMTSLVQDYAEKGFHLIEENDGWLFHVDGKFLHKVAKLTPYSDLPEGQKRCLALVAYKDPIAQAEIVKTQGNKSYAYIKHLINKGLIKSEKQGRGKILSLTQEFERYFGQNKEAIRDRLIARINRERDKI